MLNMLQVIIRVWVMNFFATQSFQRLALLIKQVTNFTGEDCLSVSSPGFWRASEFRSLCKICRSFEKGLRVRLSCKNRSSYTQAMQETKIVHLIPKQCRKQKSFILYPSNVGNKNRSSYTQAMQETKEFILYPSNVGNKRVHPIPKQYQEAKIVFLTYIYFLLLFNNNCVIVFYVWNIEIKTGELVHP